MKVVQTDAAPKAIGPYSQAMAWGDFVFCSGQLPLDPKTMEISGDDIESQTEQALKNLSAVLDAVGLTFLNVIKTTVFLKDMNDFPRMNQVYARYFEDHKPARSTVQVAALPMDALVEIECIAYG